MSGLVSAFAMSGLEGGRAGTTLDDAVAQYEGGIYDQRSGASAFVLLSLLLLLLLAR